MSSPSKESEEKNSTVEAISNGAGETSSSLSLQNASGSETLRPPAKRPAPVIEISDTDSDDSDICAVTSYQASADEVKKIRGDYSTSSSSSDYSSDSESPWEDDSIVVEEEGPRGRFLRAELNLRANRMDDPHLNIKLQSQEVIDNIKTHWEEHKDLSNEDITLSCHPYRLCLLHNFLSNPEMINNIVDDMNTLDWTRKKMDLYEYHQTADLACLTWQRSIRGIFDLLKNEVMSSIAKITGLTLTHVSAACSLYGPGDHLLVHDDMMGNRKVAFILYLAPWPPNTRRFQHQGSVLENGKNSDNIETIEVDQQTGWSPHMGGALELFSTDESGKPLDVVHQVYPENNMLAFFKVGPETFHQVGEVLSLELPRLSINGWFHSGPPETETKADETEPPPLPPPLQPHHEVVLMTQWITPAYMSPRSRAKVQEQMESDSEVCLQNIFIQDKYEELLAALRQTDLPWERCGPADACRYHRLPTEWIESQERENPIREVVKLASAPVFFRMLQDCTDLAVSSYVSLELQRWTAGDYTLLPPRERYQKPRLDAIVYLDVPTRPFCGGCVTYVAPEEASEHGAALVTVPPASNALSLVYCDAGAAGFTKYISRMTLRQDQLFYVLAAAYSE